MEMMLQTTDLCKIFQKQKAVNKISMHVRKGTVYGLLGPNGAGKTTVMKMITNLWKPTSGTIILFDKPLLPDSYEVLNQNKSLKEQKKKKKI